MKKVLRVTKDMLSRLGEITYGEDIYRKYLTQPSPSSSNSKLDILDYDTLKQSMLRDNQIYLNTIELGKRVHDFISQGIVHEESIKKHYRDALTLYRKQKPTGDTLEVALQENLHDDKNAEFKNQTSDEEFQFSSYITGQYWYQHRWTPQIDEELICKHEVDNAHDEFAIAIIKDEMVVGHVPKQISKYFCRLLKSGGLIKVKVIGTPANTKKCGIRVPCIYIVKGQQPFVQEIKNNFVCIL